MLISIVPTDTVAPVDVSVMVKIPPWPVEKMARSAVPGNWPLCQLVASTQRVFKFPAFIQFRSTACVTDATEIIAEQATTSLEAR